MQKKKGPTIIAAEHYTLWRVLEVDWPKVEKIAGQLETKKRRLFIEGSEGGIKVMSELTFSTESFDYFIKIAKKHGWQIIPLDRAAVVEYKMFGKVRKTKDIALRKFVSFNLREKYWARKVLRMKPTKDDIILMHPNHVKGFLTYSGMSGKQVIWLNQPKPEGAHWGWGRLNSRQRRKLQRKRKQAQQKRMKPEYRKRKPK